MAEIYDSEPIYKMVDEWTHDLSLSNVELSERFRKLSDMLLSVVHDLDNVSTITVNEFGIAHGDIAGKWYAFRHPHKKTEAELREELGEFYEPK